MTGEVLRLRTFTTYAASMGPKASAQWTKWSLKPGEKSHILAVVIAKIPDTMEIDDAFIEERMRLMGWERIR